MEEKQSSPRTNSPPSSAEVVTSSTYIKPQGRKPHDPDVRFEEYYYYAQRTREEEKSFDSPNTNWREILLRKKTAVGTGKEGPGAQPTQHLTEADFANSEHRLEISDEEWTNASRAFRTASWGACE